MNKKYVIGFTIVLVGILIIGSSIQNKRSRKGVDDHSHEVWSNQVSLHQMVLLENKMARDQKDNNSKTSMEDAPEYTQMYPYLYTESNKPKAREGGKKIAYLTFDDGPSENTEKILDVLKETGVKATFFLIGSAIKEEREPILRRMVEEGHIIGIHSFSHMCNEIYCSIERFLDDFNIAYQLIYDVTGVKVNIYRFPWGSNNSYSKSIKNALIDEMERRGFTHYDWNVSGDDSFGNPTSSSIMKAILKDLESDDYPVILLHDAPSNDLTAKTLPQVIDLISKKGYEFDTLNHREPYQFASQ